MTRFIHVIIAAFAFCLTLLSSANATCTGLNCSCSVTASPFAFGDYDPFGLADIDAVGNVSVTCGALLVGANISYEISLGPGASGDQLNRAMSNGGDALAYNLFTDAARTTIWGDGTGGSNTVSFSYALSLIFSRTDDFPIYGRLPAGQNVSVGAYSDTLVVTVQF